MTASAIARLRADFPALAQQIDGEPLVYLDSAATTQKPNAVIDAIAHYYRHDNSNVHRAAHALADRATVQFESARERLRAFINARSTHEVIWTRGTTEAINLVAASYGGSVLRTDDEILITEMEHHSNIVPWQLVAERTGARVIACRITDDGEIDRDDFERKLGPRTKIVALVHVSNALGTINPIAELVARAHAVGAVTVIDGAQAMAHTAVDVQALDCDFYALSAHKMYGPTGIGALYGKERLLEAMPPWQGGGEMIETVTIERTTFNRLPFKFEAGTPHIAGAIAFGAAIDYLRGVDGDALAAHEDHLRELTTSMLLQMEGVRIVGTARRKAPIVSFVVDGAHPQDLGTLLDKQGVAVRTGHHCTMPLMQRLGLPGTVRASFGLYNSAADVERLVAALRKARTFL
jgi:cysteine desulfurase/selenocysteine lyase